MLRVFLSHAHSDWDRLQALVRALEALQFEVWHSERDVPLGEAFQEHIITALEQCQVVLLAASSQAAKSPWVKSEVHIALTVKPERLVVLNLDQHPTWYIHLHLPRLNQLPLDADPARTALALAERLEGGKIRLAEQDEEQVLRDWGADQELIAQVHRRAHAVQTVEQFAERRITKADARVQQFTFAWLTRMPPFRQEGEISFALLPPGTVEYLGSTITLQSPQYLGFRCIAPKPFIADNTDDLAEEDWLDGLSVRQAEAWTQLLGKQLELDLSLPRRDHLLYGLVTRLLESDDRCCEYCLTYDPETFEKRFVAFRPCSDGIWKPENVTNPISSRPETSLRVALS